MAYPTLPFALVFDLARVTPERATLGKNIRNVSIHVQHDRSVRSRRVTIQNDDQLPHIEAEVARLISEADFDTVTLVFSTTGEENSDIGVILEKGKEPVIFNWQWAPHFGITLIDNEEIKTEIDSWSGVRLAKDLIKR